MDAPLLSSGRRRELAELRSRAYGPDADIDRDADALARLVALEEMARVDATIPAGENPRPGAAADNAPVARSASRASPTALLLDGSEGNGSGEIATAEAAGAVRRKRRRVPLWAYVAGAAAIGVGAGLAVPALMAPHPVTTLQLAPLDGAELDFQMYGIDARSPLRYESFHDLEVWSATTEQGSVCVVVTNNAEWMSAGCAPEPLRPTADITYYPGMRPIEGLELADGSVVRFVLRGGVMEVFIAATDEAA